MDSILFDNKYSFKLEKQKRTVIACDSSISSVESFIIQVGVRQQQS